MNIIIALLLSLAVGGGDPPAPSGASGAELDARAAVNPSADAVLILSFESEFPGDASASVEEGYVTLKRLPFLEQPPLGLKLRAGRFRPSFGLINVLHTHDLPQSVRPLV